MIYIFCNILLLFSDLTGLKGFYVAVIFSEKLQKLAGKTIV